MPDVLLEKRRDRLYLWPMSCQGKKFLEDNFIMETTTHHSMPLDSVEVDELVNQIRSEDLSVEGP